MFCAIVADKGGVAMKSNDKVRQGAIKYLGMIFVQRIIGLLLFIGAAGTMTDLRGIVNFSLYFLVSIIGCVMMYQGHQETLNERGKSQADTKSWDKVLLPIYVFLAYFLIYFVAGLGVRLGWAHLSVEWLYIGVFLYLISSALTIWPVVENTHFESTSRIQKNRKQEVISTGPYRIVRHPGYLGILLWAAAITLIFGTLAVGIVAGIIAVVIVIRTYLEDRMLQNELEGYPEYAGKVRCRLIPFVW